MRIFYQKSRQMCCGVLLTVLFSLAGAEVAYSQNTDAAAQTAKSEKIRVTGKVTDQDGIPLPNASVQIQNTQTGTIANSEGIYVIDVHENDVLTFIYAGFDSRSIPVGNSTVIDVALQPDVQSFDEIVVVGYGKQKKGSVVSSMSSIGAKELISSSTNITNNLAGQLAGLISIQRSAEPGRDDAEFWIRGLSSFAGGTKPLVLVDGIPREISSLEPDEIETFSVLKDAAATAVYGAEGANGVILVTSKRGIISKPRISFRAEYSLATPQHVPDFVNSWEYLELANEARFNDMEGPYKLQSEIDMYRNGVDNDLYPNTNWMKELLAKNVSNQRYVMTFRGGAENAKYFVSMSYLQQDGVFKENNNGKYDSDFDFQRYNLRSNVDLKVSKTTNLSVDLAGQYINRNTPNRSADEIFVYMLHIPSHLFPAVYSDGTLATFSTQSDANNRNPYNMLYNQGYRKEAETKIQANIALNQDLSFITPGLSLLGKVGLDNNAYQATLREYWPSLYNATGRDLDGNLVYATAVSGSSEIKDPVFTTNNTRPYRKIYMEGSVNYARVFGQHTVGGMLLFMQKEHQKFDDVLPFRKQGIVGRATYSYDNRYFVEGSFGYTGSEAFAKNHRFGLFPAVGVSYYVSNEKFYPQGVKNVMNSAKIRASIGRTGNDEVNDGRFLHRPTFTDNGYNFNQGFGTGGMNGIGAGIKDARFRNNDIRWEIEMKRNIGVDLGFFNSRIEMTVDYFNNHRTNILLQRNTIPGTAGFHAGQWQNYGAVKNWGFDGSMSAHHNFGKVRATARGTFTFARNKRVEVDELPQLYPWLEGTGTRIGERKLYIAERLYTEDDFIRTQNSNGTYKYELKPGLPIPALGGIVGPGDIKYADLNNDGKIDSDDMKFGIGHPYTPEINYGFGLNLEYKGIYISAFFQGTANTSILLSDGNSTFWPFNWGIEKSNYRVDFLDRWTAENPRQDVLMPRLHVGYANNINKEQSTWWLKNGNFLRFKNLEVGYKLPKELVKKIKLEGARVYVMGNNLCVWDSLKLWDPEMGNRNKGMSYPMSRTFTFGIELNF